ncbi:MAG TPA: hypothetical protein VML94_00040 [Thermoplasmata archaeon]|nr:hypothetical protein [Thermoplasmata archaeon]
MATTARPRGVLRWINVGLIVSVALLLAMPVASATPIGSRTTAGGPAPPASAAITNPRATWDGTNLSAASDQAQAFSINTDQRILVNFTFVVPLGQPNVTTARVQAIYFGAVISTDQVGASLNEITRDGAAQMNWTLGTFTYLLAGVYLLTASLVNGTGATVWSESFYIQAHAPYRVGSGMIVFLIVLGLVELYAILTVGRSARKRPTSSSKSPPTPWQQPAETAEPGPGTAAPPSEPPPPPEPPTEASP